MKITLLDDYSDHNYIKNYYRIVAIDLSRQKELDPNPKIEFVGQLKNVDRINADVAKSLFILTILEKNKETRLKISHGGVTAL